MNKDIEEIVVRTFFERRIQERVMFELFSPKKRDKALHRLNHDYKRNLREQGYGPPPRYTLKRA